MTRVTHELIENWRRMRKLSRDANAAESDALEAAWEAPLPASLQAATPSDIVEGAILWYPEHQGRRWEEISVVYDPTDDFKAYLSDDGCRYGLRGAFVEMVAPKVAT